MRLLPLAALALAAACGKKVGPDDVAAYLRGASPADRSAVLARAGLPPSPGDLPTRDDLVGRGDKKLTLVGKQPELGGAAPDFTLRGEGMAEVKLSDYRGKTLILSVVPSIDTRVCEAQTHHIADEEAKLPAGAAVLTVSRDLPFAQQRFLEDAQMKTPMASDFKGGSFGRDWGLEIQETGLLARSVWIIGPDGVVVYRELVADQGTEPDFDALRAAIAAL